MSLDATRWAWGQKDVKASDKIVLLSMADRADEFHCCWPAIERIAEDTCLNKQTVIASIDRLIKAGLIARKKRWGQSTIYRLIGVSGRHSIPETRHSENPESCGPSITENENSENTEYCEPQYSENTEFRKTVISENFGAPSIPENRTHSIPETRTSVFRKPGKESTNEPTKEPTNKNIRKKSGLSFENLPPGISEDSARAFADHRKALKKPLSQRALDLAMREAARASTIGLSPEQAIDETISAGWQGIKIEWLANRINQTQGAGYAQAGINRAGSQERPRSAAERVAANIARDRAERAATAAGADRDPMAPDDSAVWPPVDQQLRGSSGSGERLGGVLEGTFSRSD